MRKKQEERSALFTQRLVAFILDTIILLFACNIISFFIPTSDAAIKLSDEQTTIIENYINHDITMENYVNQMVDLSYDIARETGIITIVSIVVVLLYYVLFPVYWNGQTPGKRMMRIRIKKSNDQELGMNDMLLRTMITQGAFVNIVLVILLFFVSKDVYLNVNRLLTTLQYLVVIVSALMIAFSKKREGLHDMICHTKVVMVEPIKEEVVCEN